MSTNVNIYTNYEPRPIWNEVIHPALKEKKRAVLVCHRRFGKTVGMVNELIWKAWQNPARAPQYAYIAPFRNQAKRIAWEYLLYYTSAIPRRKVNSSELYVELPSQYPNSPGARIYIMGADYPDALRGMYLDGVVLDEFAQIKPTLYGEVVAPALSDRDGFAFVIGTPKGQNQFYDIYLKALKDKRYFVCRYRVDETKVLTDQQIEDLKAEMTDIEIRQELLCDFTASASNVVIPIDIVTESANRKLTPGAVEGASVIIAVDVARYGDDDTVLQVRKGLATEPQKRVHGQNTMEVAAFVAAAINKYKPDAVFIDGGAMGAGVIDRLRQLGYYITEVNFGQAAQDKDRYANIRAEMYFKMLDWMKQGGCIPDDPLLKAELTVTEYKFTSAGKIILQPKEEIKELTGRSPDRADALALTFAYPVAPKNLSSRRLFANTDYYFDDEPRRMSFANTDYSL